MERGDCNRSPLPSRSGGLSPPATPLTVAGVGGGRGDTGGSADLGEKTDAHTPVTMSSSSIGTTSAVDEYADLFQWTRSAISSLQDRVMHLQSGLRRLRDALPSLYDLINGAERRSREHGMAALLADLKDAVSEAEDLLDEFRWYEKKVQVEGNASQSPCTEFFDTVIQGSFNRLSYVQSRLSDLSSQLDNIGIRGVTQRLEKLVRPENTSLQNEMKIFGRDEEMEKVMGFLKVPITSKRKRATSSIKASRSASASNHVSLESRILSLHVLVIAGIGGVGKTTLAKHIHHNRRVLSHFERTIWIHVSYHFDVKRLTKEVIQAYTRKEAMTDNLNSLQHALSNHVNDKKLLIILDDLCDDALKENGQCWKRFCAPFRSAKEGSMMLVTTRCSRVTEGVCTMEPVILEGLKDEAFWNFFKLCAFGSEDPNNLPEFERIGRSILPKMKGSPLAAKILGCMLKMVPQASHWNSVLDSDMWKLKQKETEILPALWLSYMHLPFYLKQCFAFCAMYPKYYKFEKACLAEIWVAEGFVEPQGGVPIQDIGCQYFEDLVARSFFQMVLGGYIIHDLMHDLAQKVSEHDCFILRNYSGFDKVPHNVRHLCVLSSSDFDGSSLLRLCKYTKLRTLVCKKDLGEDTCYVMDHWCTKLPRMRVLSCASTDDLPDSIGNWKHHRYIEISGACRLKRVPSTFCRLYHLQILYAKKCMLESLPGDFGNLISLEKIESPALTYHAGRRMCLDLADGQGPGFKFIKNLNQFRGHLDIASAGLLSNDHAAKAELKNKKYLDELTVNMSSMSFGSLGSRISQNNEREVLEILQPPIGLKSLFLKNYVSVSLPNWFQTQNLPSLKSVTFEDCTGFETISFPMIAERVNLNEIPAVGIFPSLTDVTINGCENISSLEHFLHPGHVPAIKKIKIVNCKMLASVPTEKFGDFHFLEELEMCNCPNTRLQRLVFPSLKKLNLWGSGHFCNIDCCSLTDFNLSCAFVTSIQLQTWSLPSLQNLRIWCKSLTSVGGSITAFSSLNALGVVACDKLSTLDDLLTQEYLPSIEKIEIASCRELLSLPGEKFGSFPYLKHLVVSDCPSLNWQRGLVLPSYLQRLRLQKCGDISPYVPSCLQNLTSLVSLGIAGCPGITSIAGDIWQKNLASLKELRISDCPNLVSIGGAQAVAKIKVEIRRCTKLEEARKINRRLPPKISEQTACRNL